MHDKPLLVAALATAFLMGASVRVDAVTVGWWRMETNAAPGPNFIIPNEVPGAPSLTGAAGNLQALNGGGFNLTPTLPNGTINGGGLNGDPNINGVIAQYPELNVSSGTFEFFARSNEGDARFLIRQDGAGTGLRIDQPNALRIQYSTGAGQVEFTGLTDFNADWNHVALTYDEVSGVGRVFLDGVEVAVNDGPDNQPLTWPSLDLEVGQALDGGGGFSGNDDPFFDELRVSDTALQAFELLSGVGAPPPPPPTPVDPNTLVTYTFDDLADRGVSNIPPSAVAESVVLNTDLNIRPAVISGANGTDLTFEASDPGSAYPSAPVLRVFPAGNSDQAAAFANDGYWEFTVEPEGSFDLEALLFDAGRGGGSTPRGWALRTSADDFATVVAMDDIPTVRVFTPYNVDLTGDLFQGITEPLTFRFYVFSPGDGSTVEFDNIRLIGTAQQAAGVPEPTTVLLTLLAIGGLGARRRRRAA